jgi:RNA polymerase primary sigma factor
VWWIRQSILQALAEQARIVRLPLNKIGTINKINRAFSELEQQLERPPSAEELAELLDVPINDVKQSLQSNGRHLSMDAPLSENDESSSSLYDVLPNDYMDTPDLELVRDSLRKDIERSLCTLTAREGEVVRLYFGLSGRYPLTLEEIGEKFDLTRERVRQIKEKAIRRMKHTSRSKMLKNYLS